MEDGRGKGGGGTLYGGGGGNKYNRPTLWKVLNIETIGQPTTRNTRAQTSSLWRRRGGAHFVQVGRLGNKTSKRVKGPMLTVLDLDTIGHPTTRDTRTRISSFWRTGVRGGTACRWIGSTLT